MRIIFFGDIVGRPGRETLARELPKLRAEWGGFDFVIINCENAAAGKGMTEKVFNDFLSIGVDGMTSGNHIWDMRDFYPTLDAETRVIRPANYPPECPGMGYTVITSRNGKKKLGLLNLEGQVFMPPIDSPFRRADECIEELRGELCVSDGKGTKSKNEEENEDEGESDVTLPVLVDLHAEATSEKCAMGLYLDGRVSAVVGTHTHVQTADNKILPKGTAYISDVGMNGAHGGVIGVTYESVISRYLTGLPAKFKVECDTDIRINAVVIELDDATNKAVSITRINRPVDVDNTDPEE